jgi:hypothetical protein
MRFTVLLALLLPLFVAACQTITPEQQRAMDNQKCASFGFKRGTTAFSNCLLRLDLDRRADRRAQMQFNQPVFIYGPPYYGPGWW